jgi:hypothetical protein
LFSFWQSSLYLTWTAFAVEGVVEDVVTGPTTFVSFAGLGATRSLFEQEMIVSAQMIAAMMEKQLRGLFFMMV